MSASEDLMELSSENDRRFPAEEDIDLDLDLTGDQTYDRDGDYMVEDNNSITGQSFAVEKSAQDGKDSDMNYDGFSPQDIEALSSLQDEDINDVEYNRPAEKLDAQAEIFSARSSNDNSGLLTDNLRGQEQDNLRSADHLQDSLRSDFPSSNEVNFSDSFAETTITPNNIIANGQDANAAHSPRTIDDTEHEPAEALHPQKPVNIEGDVEQAESTWEMAAHISEPSQLPFLSETEEVSENDSESQHEYTLENSAPLHPVMIVYQDAEMFLFPPDSQDPENQQTYFLEDESLASGSLSSLLSACRNVLAESIENDEELKITFGELGLCISESTTEPPMITLSQISDLYVQLQINEGTENPEPLYLTLSATNSFSSRYDYMLRAAADGKGLSELMSSEQTIEEDNNQNLLPQRDLGGEIDFNNLNHIATEPNDQKPWQGISPKADIGDQDPKVAFPPLDGFDVTSQPQESGKVNPLLAHKNVKEDSTIEFEEAMKNPAVSHASVEVSELVQTQNSVGRAAGASVDADQHKSTQYSVGDGDFISYGEVEDDQIHGPSTRSSITQADTRESALSLLDPSIKKPTFLKNTESVSSTHDDKSEGGPKSLFDSHSVASASPRATGAEVENVEDDAFSEDVSEASIQSAELEIPQSQELSAAINLYENERNNQGFQDRQNSQVTNSYIIKADEFAPQHRESSLNNPKTLDIEKASNNTPDHLAQDSNQSKPKRAIINEHVHDLQSANNTNDEDASYFGDHEKNAKNSSQLNRTDQAFAEEKDKDIGYTSESTAINKAVEKTPLAFVADTDEITYDDDDDEPLDVLTNVTYLENPKANSIPSKRTREESYEDDSFSVSDPQDAKRFRSERDLSGA